MLTGEEQSREKGTAQPAPELKTEGPLKEEDQQNQAFERQRKLAEIALAKWQRLKQKIIHPFKK